MAGDLVDAVYRIDAWEPSPPTAGAGPGAGTERFSFVGTPDPELDARYAGRSVRAYLGAGTPGAVTYVGCGPALGRPGPVGAPTGRSGGNRPDRRRDRAIRIEPLRRFR